MSQLAIRANRALPALRLTKTGVKEFTDDDTSTKVHFVPGHWVGESMTEKGKEFTVEGATRREVITAIREKAGLRRRKTDLLAALKAGDVTEEQLVKKAKQSNPDFNAEPPAKKAKAKTKAKAKAKPKSKKKEVDPLS